MAQTERSGKKFAKHDDSRKHRRVPFMATPVSASNQTFGTYHLRPVQKIKSCELIANKKVAPYFVTFTKQLNCSCANLSLRIIDLEECVERSQSMPLLWNDPPDPTDF